MSHKAVGYYLPFPQPRHVQLRGAPGSVRKHPSMRRAWSTKALAPNSGARFLHGKSPIMTWLTRASMSMHRAVRSSPREATRGGSSISSGGCTSWTGRSATGSTAGGFCCSASAGQLSRSRASSCWPTGSRGLSAGRDMAKSLVETAFSSVALGLSKPNQKDRQRRHDRPHRDRDQSHAGQWFMGHQIAIAPAQQAV